jgi:hypothetical protein
MRDSARLAARRPTSTLELDSSMTSLNCTSYNGSLRDDQL